MAVRIGELLLKEKRITPEQLQEALNYQRQNGGKLGLNLIKLGYVKDEEITASSASSTAFPRSRSASSKSIPPSSSWSLRKPRSITRFSRSRDPARR